MSELKPMTAHRAIYFMERFKKEEKLLGPNEQAAVDFVIAMLEAQPAQVLTDDRLLAMWEGTDGERALRPTLGKNKVLSFARAIEQAVLAKRVPTKLWLWKNFVNGRPEYWAFDNAFPVHLDCGDPQTLGEPCGYALFKLSRNARPEVSDAEVLSRVGIVGEKGGA